MMLELYDVISEAEAADLVEQHDRYEYRGYHLVRSYFGSTTTKTWIVYFAGKAIETYLKPPREPEQHNSLAKAPGSGVGIRYEACRRGDQMSHDLSEKEKLAVQRIIDILRESESPAKVVLQAASWLCEPGEHVTFTTTDRTQPRDEIIAAFMAATAWVGDAPRGEVIEAYQRIREARAMVLKGEVTS